MLISFIQKLCFFIPILLADFVWARTGEVCFPFGSTDASVEPPQFAQGRPGRVGPRGPPGVGEPGPPGICSCDSNEIEQLREEIQLRDALACGVGLKDGRVRDRDITASSIFASRYHYHYARLDRHGISGHYGGWLGCGNPCGRSIGEWIQADLRTPTRVVAVVTQGLNYPGSAQYWTTGYKISYGNSTNSMQVIQNEDGNDLIFNGNNDNNSHVINEFPSPITARYFRLIVQTWNNYGVVRLEYLTC